MLSSPSAHPLVPFHVLHPRKNGGFESPGLVYSLDISESLKGSSFLVVQKEKQV